MDVKQIKKGGTMDEKKNDDNCGRGGGPRSGSRRTVEIT